MNVSCSRSSRLRAVLFTAAACLLAGEVAAQTYPARVVRFLVPYTAGGGGDIIVRTLSAELSKNLGQQVLVDNRTGANGIVAAGLLARSTPDGYTLLLGTGPILWQNPVFYRKLPYDPLKDFAPITQLCAYWYGVAASSGFAANNIPELIALAKAKPDQISYGSTGNGSPAHLAGTLLGMMAGAKMLHVPYKGSALVVTDVMAGHVDFTMTSMALLMPYVKAGRLKLLAVTSEQRLRSHPDVPTVAEAGYKGFEAGTLFSVITRAGTPRPIIDRLNQAILHVLQTPDVKERLESQGYELIPGTPEALTTVIEAELQRWTAVQKLINLHLD